MNTTDPSKQTTLHIYVLTYYIDNVRIEWCFSTAKAAIDKMCEVGKGCVRRELWATMVK